MLYVVFVLATTIMANLTLFMPSIKEAIKLSPTLHLVDKGNKYLLLISLSIMSIIFAPFMFIICLSPKQTVNFINGLTTELKKG